ncbi:hypothetical protein [Caldimonas tepidiphila]|uniref:hypothetical protein n=1 Tax=Caldimonas tepidiphila TaxID=2315841 RepID=UPI001300B27E|nr:hypothetical protein [Caldimonas tepidiphila]
MKRLGRRRMMVRMALGCTAAVFGPRIARAFDAGRPPMVNLRVELRQAESGREQSAGVDLPAPGFGAREHGGEREARQQLLVLNGGRGGLRLAQGRALQWYRVLPGPQGWVRVPATVWVEAGQGFSVQPRWPGGEAPVTVEVAAEGGGFEPRGGAQRSQLLTTLQLPLGEWVTVAESVDERQHRERGLLSGRQGESARSLLVQMRVTVP